MKRLWLSFIYVLAFFPLFSFAVHADMQKNSKQIGDTLSWVATVNKNEIKVSKLASEKTTNPSVKQFAAMMIKQHGESLTQTLALSRQMKVSLSDTKDVSDLQKAGKEEFDKLKKLKGKEFDKAYIDAMVSGHRAVLNHLDSLISDPADASIQKYLTATREVVKHHLQAAEEIQKNMG